MWSDIEFVAGTMRDANYFYKTGSKVYLYSFDFLTPQAQPEVKNIIPKNDVQLTDQRLRGVPHTWDLQYWYGSPRYTTQDDKTTADLCGKLWTNFILNG